MFTNEFPILKRKVHGQKLVFLDNASTTQKPRVVIEAISDFYEKHNANVHRGIYELSQKATKLYEDARDKVQKFLNAAHREEIIFTSGCTEAINLVVWTWGHENIHRGDEILLTEMEHHSNLVPWQELAKKKRAKLKFIPIATSYKLTPNSWNKLLSRRTKIVALTHISNVLGTINPVQEIIKIAHGKGAKVLVDGAQAGGHLQINVQRLGCDFYVLSGHKMYGPSGVGILYGKRELLETMPPYQTGGSMISEVELKTSKWNELPYKFEAGTPPIAGAVGLGAAVDFLQSLKMRNLVKHEQTLTRSALAQLLTIPKLTLYGPGRSKNRIGIFSFTIPGLPPHDLASLLDERGVAVRTGHHCAMPLHRKLGLDGTTRASFGAYNTAQDLKSLIAAIKHAQRVFGI